MPEQKEDKNLEDELKKVLKADEQSSDNTKTNKMPEEESIEERAGKNNIEPVYFFDRKQLKKGFYEYIESRDIYIEDAHEAKLRWYDSTSLHNPDSDKELQGSAAIFKMGDDCYEDDCGGTLIAKLKTEAVKKAKKLGKPLNYDAFLIEDDNVKWEITELENKSSFFSNRYVIKYSVTVIAEFYRKKEQTNA